MQTLAMQPSLVQRVCEAVVAEIVNGGLTSGQRLIQDELAKSLGVSRQPVQQALLLLRNQGLLREAPGRGLIVAPLEADLVRDLYEVRGAMEKLAARLAAERAPSAFVSEAEELISQGEAALRRGSRLEQIAADIAFHQAILRASGNILIADMMTPHWPNFQRIMSEVLLEGEQKSRHVWDEHASILRAIAAGDADRAAALTRDHLARASALVVERISESHVAPACRPAEEFAPA